MRQASPTSNCVGRLFAIWTGVPRQKRSSSRRSQRVTTDAELLGTELPGAGGDSIKIYESDTEVAAVRLLRRLA